MLVRVLILFEVIASICCFNIDVENVIVKKSTQGTLFGISVTPHIIKTSKEARILVGAPLANGSDTASEGLPDGVVYSCPISSRQDDCTEMRLGVNQSLFRTSTQFLGLTVISATAFGGDNAFFCAPRAGKMNKYVLSQTSYPGHCHAIDNGLQTAFDVQLPKCDPTGASLIKQFCLMGMSITTNANDDFLAGAPYLGRNKNFYSTGATVFVPKTGRYSNAKQRIINATTVPSYFGWSVAIGKLYSAAVGLSNVAGGPVLPNIGRDVEHFLPLTQAEIGAGMVLTFIGDKAEQLFVGRQFASRFGHSVLAVDVNKDGWDDLLIGAPEFRTENKSLPFGAAYLYLNQEGKKLAYARTMYAPPLSRAECKRQECDRARFGFALANLKDINMDGFTDVGISAPGLGGGRIFIYHGCKDGLTATPVQTLDLSKTEVKPKNLGWSLGPGLDIDDNGYPDLVAGAWETDTTVVFRTRPIVQIVARASFSPATLEPELEANGRNKCGVETGYYCFTMRVSVKAEPALARQTKTAPIPAKVTLSAPSPVDVKRLRLSADGRAFWTAVTKEVELKPTETELEFVVGLKNRFPIDKFTPIRFRIAWRCDVGKTAKLTDPIAPLLDNPVYDTNNSVAVAELKWRSACPPDNCRSDLKLTLVTSLIGDPAHGRLIYFSGGSRDVWLNFTVANSEGTANFVMLRLVKPGDFPLEKVAGDCVCEKPLTANLTCGFFDPLPKDAQYTCSLKMIVNSNEMKRFNVSAEATTVSRNLNRNATKIAFQTVVKIKANIQLTSSSNPSQVFVGNTNVLGASAIKHEIKIGERRVLINFKLENRLVSIVRGSTLTILWPFEVAGDANEPHGKYLLYLLKPPVIDARNPAGVRCTAPDGLVNPLKIRLLDGDAKNNTRRRYRRDANPRYTTFKGYQLCSAKRDARCVPIVCKVDKLGKLEGVVDITLVARPWIHTLVEDFGEQQNRAIEIAASWAASPEQPVQLSNDSSVDTKVTLNAVNVMDRKVKPPKHFSLIIAAAVVGGIILFGCLVIILWKCNFFKRTNLRQKRMELLRESQMPRL